MIESERAFVVPYLEQTREQRSLRRCGKEWYAADRIEHIVVSMKK